MVRLRINGKSLSVPEGTTVLKAAQMAGITIPTLCDHPHLTPYGGCRLCLVELKGARLPGAACTLFVTDGMVVKTETPALRKTRKVILELLLSNYYDASFSINDENNELVKWAKYYGIDIKAAQARQPRYKVDSDPNPFVRVDFNKCILCMRCIRACAEIQGRFVWGLAERGPETRIIAGADTDMLTARCESCGACAAYCPTGALDHKMTFGVMPLINDGKHRLITTTCTYCGVGCNFDLIVSEKKVVGVASNPDAPVNSMHLCVKGRYGFDFIHHPDRLTQPKVRRYLLDCGEKSQAGSAWEWVETDWDSALNITAQKLAKFRDTSGPDSVGILASAKCMNEENYLMSKLARQVIGTNNVDHCARLCHSSTVTGLATSFGSGAMSNSFDDVVQEAQALFVIGSNTTEQHPVFGSMLRQAVYRRGAKLVIADPRRIELCDFATLHLRQKPGTDIALLNGLMYIILEKGWEDKAFIEERCEGFDEFKATILRYQPEKASEITGVPVAKLYQAAEILGTNKPGAVIWAMGITQHIVGVRNVMDLANLQMLLGNMGKPGSGVNPLRGQNNVQGACDMGALPNEYTGYQHVYNEEAQAKFGKAWGATGPLKPGLTVTEIIPALEESKVKALYILAEDPVMTDPDTNHVRKCLAAADFIALQEIFPSETSPYADVLLPGVSFAEKTGTFTNTERRVQIVRQAISPVGDSRPDWWITTEIAKRILASGGSRQVGDGPYASWEYRDTTAIMAEINALTPSYGGISHARLEKGERLQWPCPNLEHPGTPILHTRQFTNGRGKFMPIDHIPPAELPDDDYPFILSTGRVLYHWHGGEMTRRARGLQAIYSQALIEVNPDDAERLGIPSEPGTDLPDNKDHRSRVKVTSRRGSIEAEAWVTERVPPGMVFANFHFPEASANQLTIGALDPVAKIPEYKVCAVKVELVT